MNLFLITTLNGLAVLLLGVALLWNHEKVEQGLKAFPRSQPATWILLFVATAWFLFHISRLGEADYGNFKQYIALGFFALAVLSLFFTPDFLGIRALAALFLLVADVNLKAAFMQWHLPQRLLLVAYTYVLIALAIYLAVSPFRARDAIQWLYASRARVRITGGVLVALGLALGGIAISMA